MTAVYLYGRKAVNCPQNPKPRPRSAWDRLRDQVTAQHLGLKETNPQSPRVRPSLATGIGMVLR